MFRIPLSSPSTKKFMSFSKDSVFIPSTRLRYRKFLPPTTLERSTSLVDCVRGDSIPTPFMYKVPCSSYMSLDLLSSLYIPSHFPLVCPGTLGSLPKTLKDTHNNLWLPVERHRGGIILGDHLGPLLYWLDTDALTEVICFPFFYDGGRTVYRQTFGRSLPFV